MPAFRYSVRGLTGDDEDDVAGLYDEQHLRPVGERANADVFGLPGGFRVRQVVAVSAEYDIPDVAGRIGVVDGSYNGYGAIGIRIEGPGESLLILPEFLAATGDRLPAPHARPRVATSTQVSVDGEIKGHSSYIVVDEIDRYL